MIFAFLIFFLIIVLSFFYLSYRIFILLVEIVKLKKLRQILENKKRSHVIKQKIKHKINKAILKKRIKKGRFSSMIIKNMSVIIFAILF